MRAGIFELTQPSHLLKKLEHDLLELQNNPSNAYKAFDFFVTAEHLPDWVGDISIKKKHVLLRVCSHLANGAKHFVVIRHNSVDSTDVDGVFERGVFEEGVFEEWLTVRLEKSEASILGVSEIRADMLAENILDWWNSYFINSTNVVP